MDLPAVNLESVANASNNVTEAAQKALEQNTLPGAISMGGGGGGGGAGEAVSGGVGSAVDAVKNVNISSAANAIQGALPTEITKVLGSVGKQMGAVGAGVKTAAAAVAGSGALDTAVKIAGSAGSAIGSAVAAIDTKILLQAGNIAMTVVGTSASVFPFLLPLQIALRDLGAAMQAAQFNKASSKILSDRCLECGKLAAEMGPKIAKVTSDTAEQARYLEELTKAINECTEFLAKFTKKGFLMKMVGWKNDDFSIQSLDNRVSAALQNLSVRLDGAQMDLQMADSKILNEMFLLMTKAGPPGASSNQLDPAILAEVAQKAGMDKSQMTGEMQELGLHLDAIEKGVNTALAKLEHIDEKLDEEFLAAQERDEALKQIVLQGQAEAAKRDKLALDHIMSLGGAGIKWVFSNPEETERLASRAKYFVHGGGMGMGGGGGAGRNLIINSHGVGETHDGVGAMTMLDGAEGREGCSGADLAHGRPGQAGRSAGHDGEDGDDGDDADAGDEGHDGEEGAACPEFEVMMSIANRHEDGCRTYKIEHSGQGEKITTMLKVDPSKDKIIVWAKGGAGGVGGRGGSGGSGSGGGAGGMGAGGQGQSVPDGGNGGNGGRGGQGTVPGLGGAGGNGSNGGRVVVHTSDPSVLMLVEVLASPGEGGAGGVHGQPGSGGMGGVGGAGGAEATWTDLSGPPGSSMIFSKTGRPGRQGKTGKNGKDGKKAPSKPSKAGSGGTVGEVSFCLYDENGLSESGGLPFRPSFTKKEMGKLRPESFVHRVMYRQPSDPFVFGAEVHFGPALPVNEGELRLPQFFLAGRLTVQYEKTTIVNSAVVFPSIAAGNATRNGTLPPEAAQTLIMKLPTLEECSYVCANYTSWPWGEGQLPRTKANLRIGFEVGGIFLQQTDMDKGLLGRNFEINLDLPVGFNTIGGRAVQGPISIAVGDKSVQLLVSTVNRLSGPVMPKRFKFGLHAAAKVRPNVSLLGADTQELLTATTGPYESALVLAPLPQYEKNEQKDFRFDISLAPSPPGSKLYLRGEMTMDGKPVLYSAPTVIRVVAPLPAVKTSTAADCLLFCHEGMGSEDYEVVEEICKLLHLTLHYVDIDHYVDASGKVPINLWVTFLGSALCIWAPGDSSKAAYIPELLQHIQQGGRLLTGKGSTFKMGKNDVKHLGLGRGAIRSNVDLTSLSAGFSLKDGVQGQAACELIAGMVCALSPTQKLKFLLEDQANAQRAFGGYTLESYKTFQDAGFLCCGGGGSRVAPALTTPTTLHDVVLSSLRADVGFDAIVLQTCTRGSFDPYPAHEALLDFGKQQVLNKHHRLMACYLYAVIHAANASHVKGTVKSAGLALLANQMLSQAEAGGHGGGGMDPRGMAERIKDIDAVMGVPAPPPLRRVLDVSHGARFHVLD